MTWFLRLISLCLWVVPLNSLSVPVGKDVDPVPKKIGKIGDNVIDTLTEVFLDGEPSNLQAIPQKSKIVELRMGEGRVIRMGFKSPEK